MTVLVILTAVVTGVSLLLILAIEHDAVRCIGGRLPFIRRILIPIPIISLLAGNLSRVWSLRCFLDEHLSAVPVSYSGNEAWSSDWIGILGLVAALIMPWLLTGSAKGVSNLVWLVWGGHFVWLVVAWLPLALLTGVPLQD